MKDLKLDKQTMTLKEITDLLEVRHNDAMKTVTLMIGAEGFGSITENSYCNNGRYYTTYQLDKRQSLAVAAKLNVSFLMRIIDRWQELENPRPLTAIELAEKQLELQIELAASKERVQTLQVTLDEHKEWSSIKRQEGINLTKYNWRKLTAWHNEHGVERQDVFDQNYGTVKSYSAAAWLDVYGVVIK